MNAPNAKGASSQPDGLDVAELSLSEVRLDNPAFRLDSQYFRKSALSADAQIREGDWEWLGTAATRVASFGAYALTNLFSYVDAGVPFLRCQNIHDGFVDLSNTLFITPEAHALLSKSQVEPGMVLLTMSGSVGNAAVATPWWQYPVNSNQDVAKVVPKPGLSEFYLAAFLNSRYGREQTTRLPVGSVQQHIFLWMIERLRVPRLGPLEGLVSAVVRMAHLKHEGAIRRHEQAEEQLVDALGLREWSPPEPLSYTVAASEAFRAGRLDASFFVPRVAELLHRLGSEGRTIADVAPPRRERFVPRGDGGINYLEIGDVRDDGTIVGKSIPVRDAPTRATWYVRGGDVVTSTVRPNRRLSALISDDQAGCVASSGFVVLEPRGVPGEVLLTYLRLPFVRELMDLYTSATLYPAISDRDLVALPFPDIPASAIAAVVSAVRDAHAERRRAQELLQASYRAIELAVDGFGDRATELISSVGQQL